jgi:hypothetical protein
MMASTIPVLQRRVLRRSYEAVGRSLGLRLLCDHLHFNEVAAGLLVRELAPWLLQLPGAAPGGADTAPGARRR